MKKQSYRWVLNIHPQTPTHVHTDRTYKYIIDENHHETTPDSGTTKYNTHTASEFRITQATNDRVSINLYIYHNNRSQ